MTDLAFVAVPAVCFVWMLVLTLREVLRGDRELLALWEAREDQEHLDPAPTDLARQAPLAGQRGRGTRSAA